MNHQCPNCQRTLFNRRLKSCGWCGTALSDEIRFSPPVPGEPGVAGDNSALINVPAVSHAPFVPGTASVTASTARNLCCPACNRVLYNRRLTKCGHCNAPIPENLRFTAAEIAALDREMAELEANRRLADQRKAEEEKKIRETDPGF